MGTNYKTCKDGKYGPKVQKVSAKPYLIIVYTGKHKNHRKEDSAFLNSTLKLKLVNISNKCLWSYFVFELQN